MSSTVILPNVRAARAQFPSLLRAFDGRAPIFLDNPGGTQVPQSVADAMSDYLLTANANTHGAFRTSRLTDEVIAEAHQAAADLLGAASAREIVFGQNMTSLTFAISRSLGLGLKPGDEIIVTHLDHDANIAPWLLLARDSGAVVRWVDFRHEDCTLDLDTLAAQLSPRTKIVAVGYASNAVGTINDVRRAVDMAHSVGALTYIDAVQYVPHGPTDVQALGADFLACSAYKFFGPHMGILYGREDALERLFAYKVRPADNALPTRFETGTQNHEGQAGTLAAINYLASLADGGEPGESRRARLLRAMEGIQAYEQRLSERLVCGLMDIPGVRVYGITDPGRLAERVPTVSITMEGTTPLALAEALAQREIYVWNGNFYALSVTTQLGLEPTGLLRIGAAHYNTVEEIDTLLNALDEIRRGLPRVS
ncbi:MAG: cysteine desulfurase-like protein [Anaerolineae bacterium]